MGLGCRQVLRVLRVCAHSSQADTSVKYQDLGVAIVGYVIPVCVLAFVRFN